jgi:hypothetical protein
MKIRIMGTEAEASKAAELIAEVLRVQEISEPYANRGNSALVRVYVTAELPRS